MSKRISLYYNFFLEVRLLEREGAITRKIGLLVGYIDHIRQQIHQRISRCFFTSTENNGW